MKENEEEDENKQKKYDKIQKLFIYFLEFLLNYMKNWNKHQRTRASNEVMKGKTLSPWSFLEMFGEDEESFIDRNPFKMFNQGFKWMPE